MKRTFKFLFNLAGTISLLLVLSIVAIFTYLHFTGDLEKILTHLEYERPSANQYGIVTTPERSQKILLLSHRIGIKGATLQEVILSFRYSFRTWALCPGVRVDFFHRAFLLIPFIGQHLQAGGEVSLPALVVDVLCYTRWSYLTFNKLCKKIEVSEL